MVFPTGINRVLIAPFGNKASGILEGDRNGKQQGDTVPIQEHDDNYERRYHDAPTNRRHKLKIHHRPQMQAHLSRLDEIDDKTIGKSSRNTYNTHTHINRLNTCRAPSAWVLFPPKIVILFKQRHQVPAIFVNPWLPRLVAKHQDWSRRTQAHTAGGRERNGRSSCRKKECMGLLAIVLCPYCNRRNGYSSAAAAPRPTAAVFCLYIKRRVTSLRPGSADRPPKKRTVLADNMRPANPPNVRTTMMERSDEYT